MAEKAQPFQRGTSLDVDADGAQSLCRSQVRTALPAQLARASPRHVSMARRPPRVHRAARGDPVRM